MTDFEMPTTGGSYQRLPDGSLQPTFEEVPLPAAAEAAPATVEMADPAPAVIEPKPKKLPKETQE